MENNLLDHSALAKLRSWAEHQELVRAMLLTSSRANSAATIDWLTDYDIVLIVPDVTRFSHDESWMHAYDEVVVTFRDQWLIQGFPIITRLVLYNDDTKIDYQIWPVELLRKIGEQRALPDDLDVGYSVLLDKDNITVNLPSPTYTAYIPQKPTPAEFFSLIEEFWWESIYVAKNLWRGDLLLAKHNLDQVMKFQLLRRLLEWRLEVDRNWTWKPGAWGRGLKKVLPPNMWEELEATYVGASTADNWEALFKTVTMFRRVTNEVASALGYNYPNDLDQRIMRYLQQVHSYEE